MTTQPGAPRGLNLRGAVDLSALRRPSSPPASGGGGAAPAAGGAPAPGGDGPTLPSPVLDVTVETFEALVQLSTAVPVVVDLWTPRSPASRQFSDLLGRVTTELGGRLVLGHVDVDTQPQIAQAFGVQQVPAVMAVLGGQPVPLFEGAATEEQVRQIFERLLALAAQQGVTGSVQLSGGADDADDEPAEAPLPPLHQEAFDAIERDDLDAAADAYRRALAENPRDAEASAGLAQVELMRRTATADLEAARAAAAAAPDDVDAQLLVADLDVLGGHVEDAFGRLVDLVRRTAGDDRDRVRTRLVELFDVVGGDDPRVQAGRRALASALF
ncbi:tetratricopeptide repeat protein [Angustibacter speluncae]